jgi:hypothetical protein
MSLRCLRQLVWLFAAPVFGATINVSGVSEVTLYSGDTLTFAITAPGYQANAARHGAPEYPTAISFTLLSAATGEDWSLSAEIVAGDGSTSALFSTLSIRPVSVQSAGYEGSAMSIRGSLQLSPEASQAIFSGPVARLALRNNGGEATVGLSPYTLSQDLLASVSGGGLKVGAVVESALLERPSGAAPASYNLSQTAELSGAGGPQSVPEPQSICLLAGGVLLISLAHVLKRRRRVSIQ